MANDVWVGAYSLEQNKYCVERFDELCARNLETYKDGFAGYSPICFGASKEEAEAMLAEARASKNTLFSEFERTVTDALKEMVTEETEVRIVHAADNSEGDAFLNEGITIIPPDIEGKASMYPIVGLSYYYRLFFANYGGYEDYDNTIVAVASELLDDIMTLWENPPE